MSSVRFTSVRLKGTGKAGKLMPDADGYYTMVIGGLNVLNAHGQCYPLLGAKQLFEESSTFMRRVQNGTLKGEVGHPKQGSLTDDKFLARSMNIEETNVCCFFKEIWLDENYGRNHPELGRPDMVAIMGKLRPSGPQGPALQKALESGDEDVCFSIRTLCHEHWFRGVKQRVLDHIISFDWVTEPGIDIATKFSSPAMESLNDFMLTDAILRRIVSEASPVVMESNDRAILAKVYETSRSYKVAETAVPGYSGW